MPGYYLAEDKVFLRVNTTDKTKGLDQMWVWSRYKSPPHPRFFAGLGYCLKNCTTLDFDSRALHWRAWDPADWAISAVLGQGGCKKRYLGTCNHFLCLSFWSTSSLKKRTSGSKGQLNPLHYIFMNKTFKYLGLFECPLCEALSLLQRTASIQIPLTRPTLSLFERHGRGGCLWSCHIRFLLLHVFTTRPCFRQSFYCSKYFLNILHTFPGPTCLHVDLTVFANCAVCWEPVHRHSLQTMSLLKWQHYN